MSEEVTIGRTDLLVQSKIRFLTFLERRMGSRADAEDLLQTAYLRAFAEAGPLRNEEKVVLWFYQLLRNLLVDYYRHRAATARLEERFARETDTTAVIENELFREVCRCVKDVSEALKPEYHEMLLRVELRDEPLQHVASELGITPNNASVRLHRARQALREALRVTCGACTEHGCLDCTCRQGAS
ncbi:MAG: RNA polymerase sigma factor [Candidatus Methylomirabilales bacterium]